jgi:hypothetical protein
MSGSCAVKILAASGASVFSQRHLPSPALCQNEPRYKRLVEHRLGTTYHITDKMIEIFLKIGFIFPEESTIMKSSG